MHIIPRFVSVFPSSGTALVGVASGREGPQFCIKVWVRMKVCSLSGTCHASTVLFPSLLDKSASQLASQHYMTQRKEKLKQSVVLIIHLSCQSPPPRTPWLENLRDGRLREWPHASRWGWQGFIDCRERPAPQRHQLLKRKSQSYGSHATAKSVKHPMGWSHLLLHRLLWHSVRGSNPNPKIAFIPSVAIAVTRYEPKPG